MGYPIRRPTFSELVEGTDKCKLDAMHKERVEALIVYDPKKELLVPSRFCSFHLAGFDLDEKSNVPLGPPYQPDPSRPRKLLSTYVTANEHFEMADSSINVISLRVVRAGPDYTYPIEVYGKVIARDEVDHKCVFLFDRERMDAQLINSEKDMLALTGPYRALVTLAWMYFEFDLKIKGEGEHDTGVQFSKGVITHFYNPYHKRIIYQLPSFQSTVKLVLERVSLPVAASIEVNVVKEGHDATVVHYDGKITAGTTRNYRQHMVVYDSSVPSSGGLVSGNGSLVLNCNLVAVKGYVEDPALEENEKLVLYVCFLDAGCEIEDEDYQRSEQVDDDDEEEGEQDEEQEQDVAQLEDEEEQDEEQEQDEAQEDDEEEDPKNVVTLRYPLQETIWENGSCKLKVKVNWTAVRDMPERTDFFHRYTLLPKGYQEPDYRWGFSRIN
ncbi:uncharacterized protein LOC124648379 [Lolium rigidum]|uniref:uncharacterized protein LOC124648379 n=1 Tax=Lolium rigidum TaxID=89674 RepID=UPI001F5C11CE|nr:uncharacterized protein LOC124648379 [Lolium rigidum]